MQLSEPGDPPPSGPRLQIPNPSGPLPSKLYKAYFDEPVLSDLTIRLSDRTVHTHRIVLCRGSKYFTKLLTGRFQETGAKDIELHEDDPIAMMALLRFLYDLPSTTDSTQQWTETLQPHALVYVAADKYQIKALQEETCANMKKINTSESYLDIRPSREDWASDSLTNGSDLFSATKIIISSTTVHDDPGRKVLIECVIRNFDYLRFTSGLRSLLRECSELGAGLIEHQDFECEARGTWRCENEYCPDGDPRCPVCNFGCFEPRFRREHRYDKIWKCTELDCEALGQPECKNCGTKVVWKSFGRPTPLEVLLARRVGSPGD